MDKLFGSDLTYNHSSAATDTKATYVDSMRSGRVKYRKMTPNGDVKTRTYGCLAIITGTAVYEVTAGGQDRTVPLRFTAIWAKRPSGIEFYNSSAVADVRHHFHCDPSTRKTRERNSQKAVI